MALKPKGALFQAASVASMGLAAMMSAMQREVPAFAARATPTFQRAPEYDGLGRKKRRPTHPRHNRKQLDRDWRKFAAKVRSTHSIDALGNPQTDPRDDKYLHSYARAWRAVKVAA